MKKGICILLSIVMPLAMAGCGNAATQTGKESTSGVTEILAGSPIKSEQAESETDSQAPASSASEPKQEPDMENKILVAYFSATGTTKLLAGYAAEILGADLYEIAPENPYTDADLAYYTGGRADQEQDDPSARPAIAGSVANMDGYDTIILGYPIWHGQAPRIISTFLESYDFSNKTIVPFCTSHSSGIGASADNLHASCSEQTNWKPGKRFEAGTSMETMREWLKGI